MKEAGTNLITAVTMPEMLQKMKRNIPSHHPYDGAGDMRVEDVRREDGGRSSGVYVGNYAPVRHIWYVGESE
jgi:hypothetical protein